MECPLTRPCSVVLQAADCVYRIYAQLYNVLCIYRRDKPTVLISYFIHINSAYINLANLHHMHVPSAIYQHIKIQSFA